MLSEYDKKYLKEEDQGRIRAIDASVAAGVMSQDEGHAYVEEIRKGAGYSGGADGSEYIALAGGDKSSKNDALAKVLTAALGGGNKWQGAKDSAAENYMKMSYDDFAKSDSYASLAKRYSDAGKKAMQDTLGEVSSRTGGIASSYAVSAAEQQYNDHMSRLEDAARAMYQDEVNAAAGKLDMARTMYSDEESKRAELANWLYTLEQQEYNRSAAEEEARKAEEWKQKQWDYNVERELEEENAAKYKADLEANMPSMSLEEAIKYKEKGYSSPEIDAAIKYHLGDYEYAPKTEIKVPNGDDDGDGPELSAFERVSNLADVIIGEDDGTGKSLTELINMLNEAIYTKSGLSKSDAKLIITRLYKEHVVTEAGKKWLEDNLVE